MQLDPFGVLLVTPRLRVAGWGGTWSIWINMARLSLEQVVSSFYKALYHFALSLTGQPGDASDLTQETFYIWATKGHQLRDEAKVKTWLFTTLYRQHLNSRQRESRLPHCELAAVDSQLPVVSPAMVEQMDTATVMAAVGRIDEIHRVPLTLFYLEEHSYAEIADILDVPIGTVMSRLARGKALLRRLLADKADATANNIVPLVPTIREKSS